MSKDPGTAGEHGDKAPGRARPTTGVRAKVTSYALGLAAAVMLTAASFYVAHGPLVWGPGIAGALLALAAAQIGIHLVFFLNLSTAPDNTNNVLALAFGILIVALLVGGSVWIMAHLDANMMPMRTIMEMRR